MNPKTLFSYTFLDNQLFLSFSHLFLSFSYHVMFTFLTLKKFFFENNDLPNHGITSLITKPTYSKLLKQTFDTLSSGLIGTKRSIAMNSLKELCMKYIVQHMEKKLDVSVLPYDLQEQIVEYALQSQVAISKGFHVTPNQPVMLKAIQTVAQTMNGSAVDSTLLLLNALHLYVP